MKITDKPDWPESTEVYMCNFCGDMTHRAIALQAPSRTYYLCENHEFVINYGHQDAWPDPMGFMKTFKTDTTVTVTTKVYL